MTDSYQHKLLANYFLNATRAWQNDPARIATMAHVAAAYAGEFELKYTYPVNKKTIPQGTAGKKPKTETKEKTVLSKADIQALQQYFEKAAAKFEKSKEPEEYKFLDRLLKHLDFDSVDRDIGRLLLFTVPTGALGMFFNDIERQSKTPASPDIIAAFLGLEKKVVTPHLKMSGPLMNSGIIYMNARDYEGDPIQDRLTYYLQPKIVEVIDNEEFNIDTAIDRLIGKSVKPETEWEDFEHIQADASYAARIVKGALARGAKGVNILVYGDTGTGKTAFCRTLAEHLSSPLYAVGEKPDLDDDDFDDDGPRRNKSTAAARLADKRLVENMLARRASKALIMFDEMEDVLGDSAIRLSSGVRSSFQLSKAATNNLLTENEIPCLWTTNNIERFDPALLRRFSFAIELKTPNADIRQRVIRRTLVRYGQTLTQPEIATLASDHALPPALYSKAVESASLAAGETSEEFLPSLQMGLRSIARLVTGRESTKTPKPVEYYDLKLVNTDQDLGQLTDLILKGKHRNFSMCGYGVSGAGKSEYMVFLAHRMGLDALLVPYSEVGSAYVSETEQNIRLKFEQASDEKKFLIFDEADSLLCDRRGAHHSWERTVVNEMLTRMERHEYPLGCTTNLMNDMDKASLRRFIFKVRFNGLTPEQSQHAYRVFFKCEMPANTSLPDIVAPGDFANVLKQAKILGTLEDPQWLSAALQRECQHKDGVKRPIGFQLRQDNSQNAL